MGTVFLGRTPGGRLVAVKVIRPEHAWDDEFRGRFRSEVNRARAGARLLHRGGARRRPRPRDALPGGRIRRRPQPGRGDQGARARWPAAPCTAWRSGWPPRWPRSTAPGSSTATSSRRTCCSRSARPRSSTSASRGRSRRPAGTPGPTRWSARWRTWRRSGSTPSPDRAAGPPADVFAWGAVVAYAGTGRTPFRADSPAATAARILTQPPDLSGLDGPLRDLVGRTLAKDPADRPTAHELLDLLLATESARRAWPSARNSGRRPRRPSTPGGAAPAGTYGRRSPPPQSPPHPGRGRRGGRPRRRRHRADVAPPAGGRPHHRPGRRPVVRRRPVPGRRPLGHLLPAGRAAAATGRRVQGPSLIDPLDRPGQWKATPPGDADRAAAPSTAASW